MDKAKRIFDHLYSKAEAGDNRARVRLAKCYYHGIGTERSLTDAMTWVEQAIRSNNPHLSDDMWAVAMDLHHDIASELRDFMESDIMYDREMPVTPAPAILTHASAAGTEMMSREQKSWRSQFLALLRRARLVLSI